MQDKPTLHLGSHHLLHGKIATLPKPYAVIRRALAQHEGVSGEVEGDAEEEDEVVEDETRSKRAPKGKGRAPTVQQEREDGEDEEEEEGPLFPPDPDGPLFQTPVKGNGHASSSPSTVYPSSAVKDYSSELDFSSPPMSDKADEEESANTRKRKAVNKSEDPTKKQRTRRYEVVGVVRKKIVFALR